MNGEISEALSAYAVSAQLEKLQRGELIHLHDGWANWVGCAYGGSDVPTVDIAARAFLAMSPNGTHASFGRSERFDLVDALSLDCMSSAVWAYDDTHLETILHPTGPVAAAALGIARLQKVSGRDFLTALHVGMEVECRVGVSFAAAGSGAKNAWYATGIAGGIGAAAAAGRLLGFDQAQVKNAMGLAAARASGNRATHGSMAAAYVPSLAAESGFISAMMTQSGFTCGARSLDGPSGLLDLITTTPLVERALRGLGEVSEAAQTTWKPYPGGIVLHPVIDACLEMRHVHGVKIDQIEQMTILVSPKSYKLTANRLPKDTIELQVSLYYWAAVTLEFGQIGIAGVSTENLANPRLLAVQERMAAQLSEDVADDQCIIEARLTDGRTIKVQVEHAVGSIVRPMSSGDIDRKFMAMATRAMPEDSARQLLAKCRGVTDLDDILSILEFGNVRR